MSKKKAAPEGAAALDDYLARWMRWTTAGLEPGKKKTMAQRRECPDILNNFPHLNPSS